MALASQTVRAQSFPRSSDALNRGRRGRNKRIVGVVLLAAVCVGIAMWAVRGGGGADGGGAGLRTGAGALGTGSARLSPGGGGGSDGVVPASPLGGAGEAGVAGAVPPGGDGAGNGRGVPTLAMGDVKEPLSAATGAMNQGAAPAPGPATPMPEPKRAQPAGGGGPSPAASEPATEPAAGSGGGGTVAGVLSAADRAVAQGRPLEARGVLNRALVDPRSTESDRGALRKKLAELNQNLVFGPAQTSGDPFSETYRVVAGDSLVKITRKLQLITEPSLIGRVNKLSNPGALKVGQTLKVLRGPFHAVVDKSEFRMDLYAGSTPSPSSIGTSPLADGAEPGWTYVCSFPVGLGAQGLTPVGAFTIKDNSKLINPHWVNPRTGEKFGADDPKNPIGERWMGLEGLDEKSKAFTGYGIHGTIDPASVGHEMSMGCVRMNAADVELVYELLTPRVSVVKILP